MSERSTSHATFVIERHYAASPARVFNAFADPMAKAQWFRGPDEWGRFEYKLDFRVGGKEISCGGPKGGTVHKYEACYQDIVLNERFVLTYDMELDDKRISVSLLTVEMKPEGTGTKLIFTEQAVFLDGYDDAGSRERGSAALLDNLGKALAQ